MTESVIENIATKPHKRRKRRTAASIDIFLDNTDLSLHAIHLHQPPHHSRHISVRRRSLRTSSPRPPLPPSLVSMQHRQHTYGVAVALSPVVRTRVVHLGIGVDAPRDVIHDVKLRPPSPPGGPPRGGTPQDVVAVADGQDAGNGEDVAEHGQGPHLAIEVVGGSVGFISGGTGAQDQVLRVRRAPEVDTVGGVALTMAELLSNRHGVTRGRNGFRHTAARRG